MVFHDTHTLKEEINKTQLLKVFPLRTNQKLPDLAFSTDYNQSPKIIEEIGLLRKKAFEDRGVNVKGDLDLDEHDLRKNNPYKSFFIWSQDKNMILASYRYFIPKKNSTINDLAMGEVFEITDKYKTEIFPHAIDLGRSFVIPQLQSRKNVREGLTVFNNTYTILGKLYLINSKEMKSFTGKITHNIPKTNVEKTSLRNALIFLKTFEEKNFLKPLKEYEDVFKTSNINSNQFKRIRKDFERQFKFYSAHLNSLIMTYYKSAKEKNEESKLKVFGTGIYPDAKSCGYAGIETAIKINFEDINRTKKELYINSHLFDWDLQEKISKDFDIFQGVKLNKVK